jgi:hypothetical protein
VEFWDAVIFTVTEETGCRLLLSDDPQARFTWRHGDQRFAHSHHDSLDVFLSERNI